MKIFPFCASHKVPQESNTIKVNNNIKASKRINFIDTSKGIGILLVVFAHINYTPDLWTIIFSFHMPLFFFISGMLFKSEEESFGAFIKKKVKTLVCPYVLFYVLSILFYLFLDSLEGYQNIDWNKYSGFFLQMFISQGSRVIANIPLWFIPCLLAVEIIYYFISKLKKPFIIGISVVLSGLGWFLESDLSPIESPFLPWSLDSALFVIGFFAIGNLCANHLIEYTNSIRSKNHSVLKILLLIILCFAIVIPLALYNGRISLGSKILNNGFILYLTGLLGTFAILNIGLLLEKSKFLLYLGKNTFYIMAVHYLFKDAVLSAYEAWGIPLYDKTKLSETILPAIIVFLLTLAFIFIYNKLKSYFINLKNKAV